MTLAESTAFFRRAAGGSTPEDEFYQALLDSGDYGETTAAAFAFALNGDEQQAEDIRLDAWPGNYSGVVGDDPLTDVHVWLDLIGFIPVIGEFADITNAALYILEGDAANAAISAAATIPFIGSLAPARRAATNLGGELIESVQLADGTVIHTIRRADGTTAQVAQLADGQILAGPSTLVRRQAPVSSGGSGPSGSGPSGSGPSGSGPSGSGPGGSGPGGSGPGGSGPGRTGTVWDDVAETGPVYAGTEVPTSFRLGLDDGTEVWIHPNATEHLAERVLNAGATGPVTTQNQILSLQAALSEVNRQGVSLGRIYNVNGWELQFSIRPADDLVVVNHALYRG